MLTTRSLFIIIAVLAAAVAIPCVVVAGRAFHYAVLDDGGRAPPSPLLDHHDWIDTTKRPKPPASVLPSRAELMEQVRQKAAEDEAIKAPILWAMMEFARTRNTRS